MPSLEEIQQQVSAVEGGSRFLARKEIKELPSILGAGERVEQLAPGFYNGGIGLLVATNRRIVFVDKGMLYGLRVEDFPYDRINSIQYKTGLLLGEITIFASGNRAEISQVEKSVVRQFGDYVRARIDRPAAQAAAAPGARPPAAGGAMPTAASQGAPPPMPPPQLPAAADDVIISKLERLAVLKQQGILTEQEFLEQKTRILRG
jgi:Bacterial PH domain